MAAIIVLSVYGLIKNLRKIFVLFRHNRRRKTRTCYELLFLQRRIFLHCILLLSLIVALDFCSEIIIEHYRLG